MFGRKLNVHKLENDRLLDYIHQLQNQISYQKRINDASIELSQESMLKYRLDKMKHQYLYLEARRRNAKAKETSNIIYGDSDTFFQQPNQYDKHW
ncbi:MULTISPECIES: YaaL family protein [Lactobacillaceae]|uniref:YaaL family protein n=1 Tax=Lactobacillaceae TaxID=33958 RepID=UPI000C1B6C3C|nr:MULTISPECIES: YaaL family protein [Lactobacillaceae]